MNSTATGTGTERDIPFVLNLNVKYAPVSADGGSSYKVPPARPKK